MKANKPFLSGLIVSLLSASLLTAGIARAEVIDERPTAPVMVADAALRPVMLFATVIGAGAYVISLPFSLMGGNADEVGQKLVVKPFKATFLRCLGCTQKQEPAAEYY